MAMPAMNAAMLRMVKIATFAATVKTATVRSAARTVAVAMRRSVTAAPSCAPIVKRVSVLTA